MGGVLQPIQHIVRDEGKDFNLLRKAKQIQTRLVLLEIAKTNFWIMDYIFIQSISKSNHQDV